MPDQLNKRFFSNILFDSFSFSWLSRWHFKLFFPLLNLYITGLLNLVALCQMKINGINVYSLEISEDFSFILLSSKLGQRTHLSTVTLCQTKLKLGNPFFVNIYIYIVFGRWLDIYIYIYVCVCVCVCVCGLAEKYIGWPRYSHGMWPNVV